MDMDMAMAITNTTAMATRRNSRPPRVSDSRLAIDVAVQMFRQPNGFGISRRGELPPGVIDVIKAAAGDEETVRRLAVQKNVEDLQIVEAAQFYLRNVLTSAGHNPHRKLALGQGADAAMIKDHKRWLLKWLHPDRNPSKWENILFAQVKEAALHLEHNSAIEPAVVSSGQKRHAAKVRQRRFHPVARSRRSLVLAAARYVAIVLGLASAVFAALNSGFYQYVINALPFKLF
jgi:hypothetical protein